MQLPIRRIDARRRARSEGYSLVEVVISVLLASVIVTSGFSVALTSKALNGQNGKNDRHMAAGAAMKEVSAVLRNFVTGCCDVSSGNCVTTAGAQWSCTSAGSSVPILGPNQANASAPWSLNGYVMSGGPVTDSCGNCYALYSNGGTPHQITGLLPSWFSGSPYNATVTYTVTPVAGPAWTSATFPAAVMPQVNVIVNWQEPGQQ
jgi:type II secretory pathway pseudopilin PulG